MPTGPWRSRPLAGAGPQSDLALMVLSVALVALMDRALEDRVSTAMFATTAAATASTMHARLAMGRWRAAVQLLACAAVLVMLGAAARVIAVVVVAGLVASSLAERSTRRQAVPRLGAIIGAFAGLTALAAIGAGPVLPWTIATGDVMAAAAAGMLAPPIMLAIAPIAEWLFGHVTPLTLTEWLNYDHPLLRELAVRAPGTFQHSVSVGLLADAAAHAIGANALLSRVGGLYHDVGKVRAPGYCFENQTGANPHHALAPEESARILRAHVNDGVELVTAHHMGRRVADFVREHHGTGEMRVFFDKAKRLDPDAAAALFHYQGPRPRSKETAIVMIADQLEALARSSPPADLSACEEITARTMNRILDSGQLADAPLDGRDRDKVRAALARTVFAMYHRRLAYPPDRPAVAGPVAFADRWIGGRRRRA